MARVGSYVSSPATMEGQAYKNLVVDPGDISMAGREVAFVLDGVVAITTHTYTSGGSHHDFLLVFPALLTPEPTPTPSPTPTPTPAVEAALPSAYSGQIVVSGGSVPEGAELVARVGSYTSPPAMIEGQGYRNLVVDPGDISMAGRAIAFVLNGVVAQTTHTYASGSHQHDFLLVFPPLPTPEPTPTPTLTPTPTPTPEVALPSVYSGPLVVSGGVVPEGAELVARIGSYVSPPATVEGQEYSNLVVDPGDVSMAGREVAFILNGVVAQTTHTYVSGSQNIDFHLVFPPLPTPEPAPTPTAEPTQDPEASDGFIAEEYADVTIDNLIVEATFVNPYSASSNPWDFGFILRNDHDDSEAPFIQVVVSSNRQWAVSTGASPPYEKVGGGTIESFDTGTEGQNHLRVIAVGERGWIFVNHDFVANFDLSSTTHPGDVAVITRADTGNEVNGAVTPFKDFTVRRLNRSYGPADGQLEQKTGLLAIHDSGVWSSDLVAEAEFVNPKGSNWQYGFAIRNPVLSRLDVIGLTDTERWFHETRGGGDNEYSRMDPRYLSESKAEFKGRNLLMLIAIGDAGWFFVNNQLVSKLDLSHSQDSGVRSVIGYFFKNENAKWPPVAFNDFSVWVP